MGTWGSLHRELDKTDENNAILNARVMAKNASENIIKTASNKVVVVDGLDDYIIIDQEEALLLVPLKKEQELKEIRARAIKKFGENLG